ncbi:hypothetical protein KEM52_001319, partial [Ascosphaera acerosa]
RETLVQLGETTKEEGESTLPSQEQSPLSAATTPLKCYAQDPVFNSLDVELLQSLDITVLTDTAFSMVDSTIFLFAPGAERAQLALLLDKQPAMFFGGPLSDISSVTASAERAAEARVMDAYAARAEAVMLPTFEPSEHAFWKMGLFWLSDPGQEQDPGQRPDEAGAAQRRGEGVGQGAVMRTSASASASASSSARGKSEGLTYLTNPHGWLARRQAAPTSTSNPVISPRGVQSESCVPLPPAMKGLALAAALAGALQPSLAVLLVPTIPVIESASESQLSGLSPDSLLPSADAVFANLKCEQCPFPTVEGGHVELGDGVDSVLSLKFTTEKGRLLMNDMQVFPRPTHPAEQPVLLAPLRRMSDDASTLPLPFGFVLEAYPVASDGTHRHATDADDDDKDTLYTVRVTVVDFNGVPVNVQPVALQVVRTAKQPHRELVFAHVDILPATGAATATDSAPAGGDGVVDGWRSCDGSLECYHALLGQRLSTMFQAARQRAHGLFGDRLKGCLDRFHERLHQLFGGLKDEKPDHHHHHHHDHDGDDDGDHHHKHHHHHHHDGDGDDDGDHHHKHHHHHHHDHDGEKEPEEAVHSEQDNDHSHSHSHKRPVYAVQALGLVASVLLWTSFFITTYAAAFLAARGIVHLHRRCRAKRAARRAARSEAGDDEEKAVLVHDAQDGHDADGDVKAGVSDAADVSLEDEAPPAYVDVKADGELEPAGKEASPKGDGH